MAILVSRLDPRSIARPKRRVDLLEPSLEPVELVGIDRPVRPALGGHGVERDEAHLADVVYVVRLGHHLLALDRAPLSVRFDIDVWARHEKLGSLDEGLDHRVEVQAGWQIDRLARAGHRDRKSTRLNSSHPS